MSAAESVVTSPLHLADHLQKMIETEIERLGFPYLGKPMHRLTLNNALRAYCERVLRRNAGLETLRKTRNCKFVDAVLDALADQGHTCDSCHGVRPGVTE